MMFRYQFIFYEIAPKTAPSFLLISKEKKNYIFVNLRFFYLKHVVFYIKWPKYFLSLRLQKTFNVKYT